MSDSGLDVQTRLDALRAQRADRADPVSFERIEALARRAAAQQGPVRELLDARLADLVNACAAEPLVTAPSDERAPPPTPGPRSRGPLAALLERFVPGGAADEAGDAIPHSPPLDRIEDVRRVCGDARADSLVRQALKPPSENAGPLNSMSLVHRALTLMRDVSPEYLQPFMAYVDALAGLEAMSIHETKSPAPEAAAVKRTRGKSASRRNT